MEEGTPSPTGAGKKAKRTRAQMAPDEVMNHTETQSGMASSVLSTTKGRSKGEEYFADREAAALATPEQKAREEEIERERVLTTERERELEMTYSPFVEYDEVWGFDDPPLGFPDYDLHLKAYMDREKGIPAQIQEEDLPAFFERVRRRSISRRRRGHSE
jgi:hypothetical protein